MTHTPLRPARLSKRFLFVWGLAELGKSLIAGTFGALLPIFYQDYLGLQASWITLASTIYALWNAFNDPLFGYITDSTRSRHGRRLPYMRFTAPFLALTFCLVWFAPRGAGQPALFWWMLVTMLLYDTCYTMIGLVYSALLPEITELDADRHGMQVSASLLGLLGTLLGFLIPDLFRPKTGIAPSFLPLQVSMIAMAVIGAALILFTASRVKERPEFHIGDQPLPLRRALRYTFTSRPFMILVAANFMSILINALLLGVMYYLSDYVLQTNAMIPLAALFIPLLIGIVATQPLRRRLGVLRTQQLLLMVAGVALVLLTFAPKPLILVCLAVAGFGLAGPQTLTNVLFAQVADDDELRSGVRREGVFFGVNALLTKPAQSVALALQSWILQITGFVTREAGGGQITLDQPVAALFGIRALIGLVPGLALILGALILMAFPLHGQRLASMQEEILTLHAAKHARLTHND